MAYKQTREYFRENLRKRYQDRIEQGLCPKCGKNEVIQSDKLIQCEECRAKQRKWNVQGRDRRRSAGLCHKCNKPAVDGFTHCEEHMEKARQRWRDYRTKVLEYYGKMCDCCGETIEQFLCIDHINGGGKGHRKELEAQGIKSHGSCFYKWIIDQGFPEEYRILCHNCNMAIGFYGKCPHEDLKRE